MLQKLHTAIAAIQGYLVAMMRIISGADFAGLHAKIEDLHAKIDTLLAQHLAEPINPAIFQIKPAAQGAELPGFLKPGATGIGSLSTDQSGTLQNQIELPAPLPEPNSSQSDQGAEVTGVAQATLDQQAATVTAAAALQADPLPPGQQAA